MIDLGKESHVHRLYTAIESSREALRPFRRNRKRMVQEYVGSWYNSSGAPYEVLVNLMNMTADVYTIGLAASNPRCRVTTRYRDLWPFAYRYQKNLNDYIEEIRFSDTLQAIVLDAFFSFGMAKTFQADWKSIQLEDDIWADPGRPYTMRISPDDCGFDMSVKDYRRCKFIWDEYRVSWDSLRNDSDMDKSVIKRMNPTSKWERPDEQANDITSGDLTDNDEYEPMVDLMDVYLPDLDAVGIFPRHITSKPLKLVDAGVEGGPYSRLSLADTPDNAMPVSPAMNQMGLHLLYNGLLRKQARQAKRQKTNPTFRASATSDADRMKRVNDGDWVKVQDPSAINIVSQGGVDQANVLFSVNVLDLFDRQAGNLQAMAGLGPQAGTVGQEEIIHNAVSRKEAKMQQRVHRFTVDVIGGLGQLMWADEFLEVNSSMEVAPGTGVHIDSSWTPEMREGDFWQYNFDVEPYSMNYESPETKLMKLERALNQAVQLFPMIQQAGGTIDVQQIMRDYGALQNTPEIENWVTFSMPSVLPQPNPTGGSMPQQTSRTYVRKNVATGGTPQARSDNLKDMLSRGFNGSGGSGQANSVVKAG